MLGVEQYEVSRIESGKLEPRASVAEAIRVMTDGRVVWEPSTPTAPDG